MKVLAMKDDPSRRFQEMADIRSLLLAGDLDMDEIRGCFRHHEMEDRLDEILRSI